MNKRSLIVAGVALIVYLALASKEVVCYFFYGCNDDMTLLLLPGALFVFVIVYCLCRLFLKKFFYKEIPLTFIDYASIVALVIYIGMIAMSLIGGGIRLLV